jgi:adenylylsulfate kinase
MSGEKGFAVWITGIPASGKSSITRELVLDLNLMGISPAVLESDSLRTILTPALTYMQDERDRFYLQLAEFGALLARQGIPVLFDATANRRAYRDHARSLIARFVEVFVNCNVDICRNRDPKGIYAAASLGSASNVPGIQAAYENPQYPEVILDCIENPSVSAKMILEHLKKKGYV